MIEIFREDGPLGADLRCLWVPEPITLLLPDGSVAGPESECDLADRPGGPFRVQVDLDYRFDLFMPIAFDVNGHRFGIPENLTFGRTSVLVNSDFLTVPS